MRGYEFERVAEEVVEAPGIGAFVYTGRAVVSELSYDYDSEEAERQTGVCSCW